MTGLEKLLKETDAKMMGGWIVARARELLEKEKGKKEVSIGKFIVKLQQTTTPGKMGIVETCTLKASRKNQVFKYRTVLLPYVGKRVEVFFRVKP